MRFAYVVIPERGALDPLMADLAQNLHSHGLRLAGVVQSHHNRPGRLKCDLALQLLPDGALRPISQDLGPLAEGCRLDVGALESVVIEVSQSLPGADLLLINRFGKIEAEGRGFVSVISEALGAGQSVLIGVAPRWVEAFGAFAGDLAEELPADLAALEAWART